MKMLGGVQLRAVLIALFAFYVAPLLPLVVITSIPNFLGFEPGHRFRLWQSVRSDHIGNGLFRRHR
jgi:hypothetical protein